MPTEVLRKGADRRSSEVKVISARIPPKLHDAATRLAKQENKSINDLLTEILTERLQRHEDQELFDAFTRLGEDDFEVEFAVSAQSEVVAKHGE
ncbi:MAG: hypothetical protein OHK0029_41570 [Armatimonadaceae bacterium]